MVFDWNSTKGLVEEAGGSVEDFVSWVPEPL